jgi:hypothetical protein
MVEMTVHFTNIDVIPGVAEESLYKTTDVPYTNQQLTSVSAFTYVIHSCKI